MIPAGTSYRPVTVQNRTPLLLRILPTQPPSMVFLIVHPIEKSTAADGQNDICSIELSRASRSITWFKRESANFAGAISVLLNRETENLGR